MVQWVPGHCELPGNELADQAAEQGTASSQDQCPITYSSARALILRTFKDPPPTRFQTIAVYGPSKGLLNEPMERLLSVEERRLMGQLRSGHCPKLRSYLHRIQAAPDALCPKCTLAEENNEHLTKCDATRTARIKHFGCDTPPLSSFVTSTQAWMAQLRETRPEWFPL